MITFVSHRSAAWISSALAFLTAAGLLIFWPQVSLQFFLIVWTTSSLCSWGIIAMVHRRHGTGKATLGAALPMMIAATVFTAAIYAYGGATLYVAFMWMLFHAFALQSARAHLPTASAITVYFFLVCGLALSIGMPWIHLDGNLALGLVFGAGHLLQGIYASGANR